MSSIQPTSSHSQAWVVQTWLAFGISVGSLSLGIFFLPVDAWVKGYMGMGTLFALGSTASLSKTLTGDKVLRELAASGIEHRNRAENRAVYGV
jgi:hypothetical protein